ncbi:CRISPR-associated endonuclease Cas6 [Novipirellula galeiformis]|uniref:CRISPR-associated endonuclease Cas6 n=1 Tax=Novipirellula galeiformis TaxID=2528004 RepID=A0A5C6CRM9_9BACT|nr:type I-MYXAN CRISPR-associated protein Cas6/Cmx6 [Novipirellula galeiformis]TWU26515.1 CRISPR-associated endonuclease Cas6 [Novipirellula galeiformis]
MYKSNQGLLNLMQLIELSFPALGQSPIPADHGYALLGAVTQLIPTVHGGNGFALAPIPGRQVGGRQMALTRSSRLIVRTTVDRVGEFLPLAGKQISLAGRSITLGVPTVQQIAPASQLRARLVTIKGFFAPTEFTEAVQRQLDKLEIAGAEISVGRQRTIRVKQNEILGFETTLSKLDDESSLKVLADGIGGRRHMGCGVFVPCQETSDVQDS